MGILRESGFFNNRGENKLFYTLVTPEKFTSVWVFCNPFLEEKVYTESVYKSFADHLAENGYAVMRFDYLGDGDSEGILEDINLNDWRTDIVDACGFAKNICQVPSINLFGLRLGASLAYDVASKLNINRILLWDPVLDGEDYLNQLLRFNLTTQLSTYGKVHNERSDLIQSLKEGSSVNILGYEITQSLADSLCNLQIVQKNMPDCIVNIVTSTLSSSLKPPPQVAELVNNTAAQLVTVKARPFWHEPRFIDVRQKEIVDASLKLLSQSEIKDISACN